MIAENPKWELVDIFSDQGVSGATMENRPGLQRLLQACETRQVDRILVKSISRFARNVEESLRVARGLKEEDITIYFEKEKIDTSSDFWELAFIIIATLAEQELQSMSKRMRLSVAYQKKNNAYKPTTLPYGYEVVDNLAVVVDNKSKAVKLIFDYYLSGYRSADIIKELEDNTGKVWNNSTITRILKDKRYTGGSLRGTPYVLPQIITEETFEKSSVLRANRKSFRF